MLSEKDLKKIREVIRDELTIKNVTVERLNSQTNAREVKTVDLYMPEWIAAELPNLANALRGVQETADHAKNNSFKLAGAMNEVFNKFGEKIIEDIENRIIDNDFVNKIVNTLKYDEGEILKIESSD